MPKETDVKRIPDQELAELWFSFKQNALDKLQTAFRRGNLSQEDIAVRLGRDPATISRCLRGRTDMNLRTMHDLARGMGCRLRIELDHLDGILPVNRPHGETWQASITGTTSTNTLPRVSPLAH